MNQQNNTGACNVVIGGEAGQGLVTVGELLAKSLVRAGYHIVATQGYMSRIRGGHNTFAIRAGVEPIAAPAEPIDLLAALNAETIELHQNELSPAGMILADEKATASGDRVLKIPLSQLAPKRSENMAVLGVVGAVLGLDPAHVAGALDSFFSGKKSDTAEENQHAVSAAYAWAGEAPREFPKLAAAAQAGGRIMLNGNEALACGALAAGVKFCAFYPMTPSTSIPLTLIRHTDRMGVIVEQAEDEIAAINMALGASLAGAPALVATAGGGFALMTESVSLAGMTETPIVIIVAQRPAPATGLPTRTEQADLELVLHAGHGEFPRAILTPGSVQECFQLAGKAFLLADRYQGPIFLLTDQFLADSHRDILPFDLEQAPAGNATLQPAPEPGRPYQRFAITESGVSPRLIPGMSRNLVVVDSDEHTEDGHITEDLNVRRLMVDKRLRKLRGITAEVIPPVFQGDDKPDILLVSWGSSQGAVAGAAVSLRDRGMRVGTLHFPQVWPLVPEHFVERLAASRQVVVVEGNATGQFSGLIRRETGVYIKDRVLRYDGLPFTPEYILRSLPHGIQG